VKKENDALHNLGLVARECEKLGVPLIAEMVPVKGDRISNPYDAEIVSLGARVGAELGADIIKTHFTGSEGTFRKVVESCPIPIVVAGGPKMKTERRVLEVVEKAVNAGAVGVAFGRNIWQHENPEAMTRAIRKIVHEGVAAQKALKEIAES
jgi:DhnA family fructose-bisphosphate aldolase class Ia